MGYVLYFLCHKHSKISLEDIAEICPGFKKLREGVEDKDLVEMRSRASGRKFQENFVTISLQAVEKNLAMVRN